MLPIIKYSDVEEAIASANRLDVGHGASVWWTDVDRAKSVAIRIQAGTVRDFSARPGAPSTRASAALAGSGKPPTA